MECAEAREVLVVQREKGGCHEDNVKRIWRLLERSTATTPVRPEVNQSGTLGCGVCPRYQVETLLRNVQDSQSGGLELPVIDC